MSAPVFADTRTAIALVDDHPVILEGIASVFSADCRFQVIAKGSSAADAVTIVESFAPDVVLIDLHMPGDTLSAISRIHESGVHTKLLVFTAHSPVDTAMKVLDAGASGLVLKGATCGELFEAVAAVLRGETYVDRQFASQVFMALRRRSQKSRDEEARLNVREQQIVDRLMKAQTNREIAASLSISEKTVKRYMTALMLKLKARNRVEVVLQAQKHCAVN